MKDIYHDNCRERRKLFLTNRLYIRRLIIYMYIYIYGKMRKIVFQKYFRLSTIVSKHDYRRDSGVFDLKGKTVG